MRQPRGEAKLEHLLRSAFDGSERTVEGRLHYLFFAENQNHLAEIVELDWRSHAAFFLAGIEKLQPQEIIIIEKRVNSTEIQSRRFGANNERG